MRKSIVVVTMLGACVAVLAQTGPLKPWSLWGQVWASAFGQWRIASLTMVPRPGTYKLELSTAAPPVLPGGQTFQPLATNAPITVDPGANQEIVTPSAVSCSFSQGFCSITVTLSRAHNYNFAIESGTDGLQEALNYQKTNGGGVVIDPFWGGTTSIITSAAGSANVEIVDERTGQTTWYGWNGSGYQSSFSINNPAPNFGALTAASITTTGALSATGGGTLGGTFSGTPVFTSPTISGGTLSGGTISGTVADTATHSAPIITSLTATGPEINAGGNHDIEQTVYSDQLQWSQAVSASVSAGSLVTFTPSWTAIPTGLESGALSSVSESSSSATVTWVSGDKFNTNWASGKAVVLDGVALTISSCSSATTCTLSGDAPQTNTHGWMAVGYPTPVRISGGTGTAETFDVLGIGASECPGGSALSICGTLANSHSGSWTVASATDGIQEAVNEVERRPSGFGKGAVHVPAPTTLTTSDDWSTAGIACWITHGPVVVSRAGVSIFGDGQVSSHICNSGEGAGIFEVNTTNNLISDLYVSGSTGSGPDFEWYGTLGYGDNSMMRVHADGATGTFTDPLGSTVANAGIYVMGSERFGLYSSTSGSNNRGVVVVENPQANGTAITSVDGDYLENAGDGFSVGDGSFSVEGCNVLGGRIFGNGGAGIRLNCTGGTVHGVYLEGNVPSIVLSANSSGISVTGNQIEQSVTTGDTMISGGSSGSAVQNLTYDDVIAGNHMVWDGTGTSTANSFIDGWFIGSLIGPNSYDWFSTTTALTVPYGVVLEDSSVASGAATNTVLASTYGPNSQFNSSGHLTITTAVDDLTAGTTSTDITQDYHQAATVSGAVTAPTVTTTATAGDAAILFGSPSDNAQFAIEQNSNTAVLSWWPHNSVWSCATGSPGICTFDYAAVLAGGATLPSGQTLTNSGTISGGAVSADITNTCSGTSAAMTAGTVTVSNACITGSRPIMLVEAAKGGTQGILSYTQSSGSLVISSTSSTDTSTVSWAQN